MLISNCNLGYVAQHINLDGCEGIL